MRKFMEFNYIYSIIKQKNEKIKKKNWNNFLNKLDFLFLKEYKIAITNLVKHFQTQSLWINSNVPAICLLLETTPVRLADDLKTFGLVVKSSLKR